MATALIEQFTGTFKPERYEDTYRDALLDVIKAKRKGKTISAPEPETEEEPADLLAALRASVDAAKRSRGPARRGRPPASRPAGSRRGARSRRSTVCDHSGHGRLPPNANAPSSCSVRSAWLRPRRASGSAMALRPSSSAASAPS